jgi:uncharacterized protein (TIRG00374 family)
MSKTRASTWICRSGILADVVRATPVGFFLKARNNSQSGNGGYLQPLNTRCVLNMSDNHAFKVHAPNPIGSAGVHHGPRGRTAVWGWFVGVVAFAAVLAVALRLSELEEIARLLRRIRPVWLLAAFVLQGATYLCAAGVWQVALARAGYEYSTRSLVPVSLAMLFTNQAVPSAGVSGSAVVLRALGLRGVQENAAMAAVLVGLLSQYAAYVIAIAVSVLVLAASHLLNAILIWVIGIFAIGSVAVPLGILWYMKSATSSRVRDRLARIPALGAVLVALASAPTDVVRDRVVIRRATGLQLVEIVLDATTLYVTLAALDVWAAPLSVFASFVMAFAAARAAPTPLGLGTFDGASIGMLTLTGVQIEAALAATLLFRAYTLWLPMVPGFWCMRFVLADRSSSSKPR